MKKRFFSILIAIAIFNTSVFGAVTVPVYVIGDTELSGALNGLSSGKFAEIKADLTSLRGLMLSLKEESGTIWNSYGEDADKAIISLENIINDLENLPGANRTMTRKYLINISEELNIFASTMPSLSSLLNNSAIVPNSQAVRRTLNSLADSTATALNDVRNILKGTLKVPLTANTWSDTKKLLENGDAIEKSLDDLIEALTAVSDSKDSLEMSIAIREMEYPIKNVSITLDIFAETEEPVIEEETEITKPIVASYTDVDKDHWAYEAIEKLSVDGIVQGMGDGTFGVEKDLTRAQFATIIQRAFNFVVNERVNSFSDVTEDDWYADSASILATLNIMQGYGDGTFRGDVTITREQMATVIFRVIVEIGADLEEVNTNVPTDIDDAQNYAKEPIIKLYQAGVIDGVSAEDFAPREVATRGQVAQLVYNILEY